MVRATRSAPTLSDVARHAGVSLATASRAINGSETRTVGEELRRRVIESAQLLGYAPNANAQAMARGATRTIGVVVHDLTDPYFAEIADRWKDPDLQRALRTSIEQYVGRGGRVVALGMDFPGVDCVQVANEAGASALAQNLVDLGYRHPLLLTGPERHSTAAARAAGFASRMADLGHPLPPTHRISSDFTRTGGTIGMRLAIEARLDYDVVVATSDVMALGARREASRSGIRIPRDVGLTGFGDVSTLIDVTPGLTTVRVPTGQLARLGLDLALHGPGDGTGSVVVDAVPVMRDSTPRRNRG